MARIDRKYHKLLRRIKREGYLYNDPNREGVKRLEIPSYTFRHEFKDGFPAITTKKLNYSNVVAELLWFLKGDTNIKYLLDNKCNIWNKDAYNHYKKIVPNTSLNLKTFISRINEGESSLTPDYEFGDLGPVYGRQWRNFDGVDQFANLLKGLREKPLGTEHIVNSWNASQLKSMALPPCHYGFQILVRPSEGASWYDYEFELHWTQRSVDTFLGLPYNIASYATLAQFIEKITGYHAVAIQGDLKKVHLYDNSFEAVDQQFLVSTEKYNHPCWLNLSRLNHKDWSKLTETINGLIVSDFVLEGYESAEAINVPMLEKD